MVANAGIFFLVCCTAKSVSGQESALHNSSEPNAEWILIDDFESTSPMDSWTLVDTQNETDPNVENPQITEVRSELNGINNYLIKKPADEGIVGNRKAISFKKLPVSIDVGDTYTFYVRLNVEYFPNNHVLGLSNMEPEGIIEHAYDALEPSLRITDRYDSNVEYKNDGTLLVRKNEWYDKIYNEQSGKPAKPMQINTWYEVWCVVNNSKKSDGGQTYDVYIRGGEEFPQQQKVYIDADFRMKRELPIIYFMATCNTGPKEKPYGNGGVRYDDLYMVKGRVLSAPINRIK